ncbi:MAG: aminoacyl-tRNA hydrolase [Parvularcula sp.]|jgi:PTH1 family peptidyl-tRNA hydrolase|nr:aminoacyl-tRNA hydrolase [Parvularcula sp.]
MILLVGLGNPGAKYAGNRHNVGFMMMDAIADRHGLPAFRSKFQGETTEGRIGEERVILLKPQTFYNESGRAVQEAARFHKITPDAVIVFHDEIDLAPGKLRVKKGGGLAGNNGLKSIAAHLSPDVWRVRIGIGHPGHKDAVTHHVLKDFAKEETGGWLGDMLQDLPRAIPHLLPPTEEGSGRFVSATLQPGAKAEVKPARKPSPLPTPPQGASKPASPFDALKSLVRRKD